jgi:hypothetical protein
MVPKNAAPVEVIDFFAPPREDFLLGKPAYISEG